MAEHHIHKSKPWLKSKGQRKLTPELRDEVVRRYMEGEKRSSLTKEFGINSSSITALAKHRGFIRKRIHWALDRRRSLNDDVFSIITPESAYWIGIMMSDGHCSSRRFGLGLMDKEHIEKFLSFLGSTHSITTSKPRGISREYRYSFLIVSEKIVFDLAKYGVAPRKSLTAKVCDDLAFNKDFWRGVIDGDGSIFFYRVKIRGKETCKYRIGISLAGSLHIVQQFIDFIKLHEPNCKRNPTKAPHGRHYLVSLVGGMARNIIKILYNDNIISLDRKNNTARNLVGKSEANGIFIMEP